MKLMILGDARHGKDTACEYLRSNYNLRFVSSSLFVAERAVLPALAAQGITYPTFDDAYADRVNHRDKWFNAIAEYNHDDPARLSRELLSEFDIYCGIRNVKEFKAAKAEKLYDFALWIDASRRVPPEDKSSQTITWQLADYVIDNNYDVRWLHKEINVAMSWANHAKRTTAKLAQNQ